MPFSVEYAGAEPQGDFRIRWSPLMIIMLMELRSGIESTRTDHGAARDAVEFFRAQGIIDMNGWLTQKGVTIAQLLCQQAALLGEGL